VPKPYDRVHLDLIPMTEGYNGDRWVLHFLDDFSRMNHVYMMNSKSLTSQTVKDFIAFIHRHFDRPIRILRTDGETSLGISFTNWVVRSGITFERSVPYTPEQNGAAE
jgi:hypothetical protein